MILVIGGFAAGKKDYVMRELGFVAQDFSKDPTDGAAVLYELQSLGLAPDAETLALLCRKQVIICDEVGCGLVPMDAAQRQVREDTGRLCIALAAHAQTVVRVVCGVANVIR